MTKCLIIEDEVSASNHLKSLLLKLDKNIEISAVIDSVKSGIQWFESNQHPDLIFSDIQIADGLSFTLFDQVHTQSPIIFTTAYDEYAIQAFKLNSIDYLLKPIDPEMLRFSYSKYVSRQLFSGQKILELIKNESHNKKTFRRSFLVSFQDRLIPVLVDSISYIFILDGIVYAQLSTREQFPIELKMDEIMEQLDPNVFFRANRQFIISKSSIKEIILYFNSRLLLKMHIPANEEVVISKEKVNLFKKWFEEV
ncbi:MAG: response regulator transcription factor [Bacteroidetes bacterium]|nr:response regulator transcription factor [Bacteroidota bacterium]